VGALPPLPWRSSTQAGEPKRHHKQRVRSRTRAGAAGVALLADGVLPRFWGKLAAASAYITLDVRGPLAFRQGAFMVRVLAVVCGCDCP